MQKLKMDESRIWSWYYGGIVELEGGMPHLSAIRGQREVPLLFPLPSAPDPRMWLNKSHRVY